MPANLTPYTTQPHKPTSDPMRVTKKFSGTSCIGKSVFCPAEPTAQNLELIKVGGWVWAGRLFGVVSVEAGRRCM